MLQTDRPEPGFTLQMLQHQMGGGRSMCIRACCALQVRCEVAATMQKLAASSFVFVALHLWMQGVPPLHIALDMAASVAVALWLCPTVAAFAEVLSLWPSTLITESSSAVLCVHASLLQCRGRSYPEQSR